MKNLTLSFFRDETAATAIEYGLIAAGISVAIIAVVQGLGTNSEEHLLQRFDRRLSKWRDHEKAGFARWPKPAFRQRLCGGICRVSAWPDRRQTGMPIE